MLHRPDALKVRCYMVQDSPLSHFSTLHRPDALKVRCYKLLMSRFAPLRVASTRCTESSLLRGSDECSTASRRVASTRCTESSLLLLNYNSSVLNSFKTTFANLANSRLPGCNVRHIGQSSSFKIIILSLPRTPRPLAVAGGSRKALAIVLQRRKQNKIIQFHIQLP
jgi:hypothetical protein